MIDLDGDELLWARGAAQMLSTIKKPAPLFLAFAVIRGVGVIGIVSFSRWVITCRRFLPRNEVVPKIASSTHYVAGLVRCRLLAILDGDVGI